MKNARKARRCLQKAERACWRKQSPVWRYTKDLNYVEVSYYFANQHLKLRRQSSLDKCRCRACTQ